MKIVKQLRTRHRSNCKLKSIVGQLRQVHPTTSRKSYGSSSAFLRPGPCGFWPVEVPAPGAAPLLVISDLESTRYVPGAPSSSANPFSAIATNVRLARSGDTPAL